MEPIPITNVPTHLQGELYNTLMTEFAEDDTECVITGNIRPLKLDLEVKSLVDVIQLIDTCMFFGVPLHCKIFEFVKAYSDYCLREMKRFEKSVDSNDTTIEPISTIYFRENSVPTAYAYIIETEEYRALKLLANYTHIWTWSIKGFLEYAIKHGSLVLVEHYAPKYSHQFPYSPLKWAAEYGQIPIMAFLVHCPWVKVHKKYVDKTQTFAQELCSIAASKNQLSMLKYLRETLKFDWNMYTVQYSICDDRLDILKYALENGCPIPEYGINMAIGIRSIEGLRMLVDIRQVSLDDPEYTLWAAENGHVDHLQYLHENNAPWHSQAINIAAEYEHIDCVDYGISVGAPYDP